jgi:adenylate cyclase
MQYGTGAAAAGYVRSAAARWRAYDRGMHKHNVITALHHGARQCGASLERSVREHLQRVLHSPQFDDSARSRDFLRFVVEEALAGRGDKLNQGAIAVAVFGRRGDFDALIDPIVRVQAGRLRRSLERYYLLTDCRDSIRIELHKGSYAPTFIPAGDTADASVKLATRATLVEWATLVVHLFEAGCSQDEPVAARMADELSCELHRHGEVRVLRQHDMERLNPRAPSSGRFELRGRVRREADEYWIGVRLVDRANAEQVWSDEYRASTGSGADTLDDIARVIAARIGGERGIIIRLLARENHAHSGAPFDSTSAILRCHHFFLSRDASELAPTLRALQVFTAREPSVAAAWTCLARLYLANHSPALSDAAMPIEQAIDSASRSVLLDPASARARCVLAAALLMKGELHAARHELEQALLLNSRSLA